MLSLKQEISLESVKDLSPSGSFPYESSPSANVSAVSCQQEVDQVASSKEHPSDAQLLAFSVGLLSQADAIQLEIHVDHCTLCGETLLRLSSSDTFVEKLKDVDCSKASSINNVAPDIEEDSEESIKRAFADHPRYEITNWIARGGMGDVFKAEHRSMGRTVAVKVIGRKLIKSAGVLERFQREVRTAARLSHPNIVTAYDAERADDFHFLVMEYVDGVNLATLARGENAIPIHEACEYVRQAAIGLQYAHEQGVVHRDIKPHNLMLSGGTIKMLDFGLASFSCLSTEDYGPSHLPEDCDLTATGAIIGTPDFMSPEQASNSNRVDFRSDIYSLGATLYFLLTGRPPFPSGSIADRLKRLADSDPKPIHELRSSVPHELECLVRKMMEKDPDKRFQSSQAIATALEPYVGVTHFPSCERIEPSHIAKKRSRFNYVKNVAISFVALIGFGFAGIVYVETDKGTFVIESIDDSVKVIISQVQNESGGTTPQSRVIDTITGSEVKRLPSGEYRIALESDDNQLELTESGFILRRGSKVVASVIRKQSPADELLKKPSKEKDDHSIPLPLLRLSQVVPEIYLIDKGDILGVWIDGLLTANAEAKQQKSTSDFPIVVQEDGAISLPSVAPVNVRGMSTSQVQELIKTSYRDSKIISNVSKFDVRVRVLKTRTYDVFVHRGDLAQQRDTKEIEKMRTKPFQLAAYQNDVLHALMASGGLPGSNAANEITILRAAKVSKTKQDDFVLQFYSSFDLAQKNMVDGPAPTVNYPHIVKIPLRITAGVISDVKKEDVLLENGDLIFVEARDEKKQD